MRTKTKSALKHDKQRLAQSLDEEKTNHTIQKLEQLKQLSHLLGINNKILELFPGNGKLTDSWNDFGAVTGTDGEDAFSLVHKLIYQKKKFNIIDIDAYGYPSRFFPDIFKIIDQGYIFITFPSLGINVLNGITKEHLRVYWGSPKPSISQIRKKIEDYGICHWRSLVCVDLKKLGKRMFRFCFLVEKVNAAAYCGVRNQRDRISSQTLLVDY